MSRGLIRLHLNENCYGPSSRVREVIQKAAGEANRYPHQDAQPLRSELSRKLEISEEQIILGNGSSALIEMIAGTFLSDDTNCVSASETFSVFRSAVLWAGATYIGIPLRESVYDLTGILNAINEHTRLVLIANPNNPTGTMVSPAGLIAFLKECPSNIVVVLDAAYGEYLDAGSFPDPVDYLERFPNVIVLRTFSKAYSLAGLRLGYGIAGKELISKLNQRKLPFNISLLAQAAGIAALQDEDHILSSREKNKAERAYLQEELARLGVSFVPSITNFVLILTEKAARWQESLLKKEIAVAHTSLLGIPGGLRVTVGTREENDLFLSALRELLNEES